MFNDFFLESAAIEAARAQHVWPEYAACEAALESGFGSSELARLDNNLFGMKQHRHPVFGTHVLPTNEFLNGEWEQIEAAFVHYPDVMSCFADRMATLKRLAGAQGFEHYAAALDAGDGEIYVQAVSLKWSTDPKRGDKVMEIYSRWKQISCKAASSSARA